MFFKLNNYILLYVGQRYNLFLEKLKKSYRQIEKIFNVSRIFCLKFGGDVKSMLFFYTNPKFGGDFKSMLL